MIVVHDGSRNQHLIIFASLCLQLNVVNEVGWEDTVIWNPYGNEGMGYNNFVCVESVKVSDEYLIAFCFFPCDRSC